MNRMLSLTVLVLISPLCPFSGAVLGKPLQPLRELELSEGRFATVEVLTDHGKFEYHLDNTGERDLSAALQEVFNRIAALKDTSATFVFLPGVYFIDAPITVKLVCLELRGNGHGGQDIHGMNLKSGTIVHFGKNTGPNCITFQQAGPYRMRALYNRPSRDCLQGYRVCFLALQQRLSGRVRCGR